MPDSALRLAPGHMIGNRYFLSTPLGEGGMASVWRATDATRDVDVAIKFVNAVGSRAADLVSAFAREADLSERMLSRNIVRVLDRGASPRPYIVLELLQGETLAARLSRGTLGAAEAIAIITQICRARERAHGVGIAHRDIKPDNVFLCPDEGTTLVKVLDFGIAALGVAERTRDIKKEGLTGTVGYMSPEHMLDGVESDARSDLFALGVIAYECFTSRIPFADRTLAEYMMAVSTKPPAPPSALRLDLPPGIDDWMTRALAFDRTRRFASAREMADALTEVHRPMVQAAITASRRARARSISSAVPHAPLPPRISPPPPRAPSTPPARAEDDPPRPSKPPRPSVRPTKPPRPSTRPTKPPSAKTSARPARPSTPPKSPAPSEGKASARPSRRPPVVPAGEAESGATTSYSHVVPRSRRSPNGKPPR